MTKGAFIFKKEGGPEEFRGGSLTFCLPKRGGSALIWHNKDEGHLNFTASKGRVTLTKSIKGGPGDFTFHFILFTFMLIGIPPAQPPSKKWTLPKQTFFACGFCFPSKDHVTMPPGRHNRPFYSCVLGYLAFEWKWGLSWPCFHRNFPAFLMLMLFSC